MEQDIDKTRKASISSTVGNGLLANQEFSPGDVIIHINEPYVVTPEVTKLTQHCYNCFADYAARDLSKCSGCRVAHYCSTACQQTSWNRDHKKECKIFKMVNDQGLGALPTPVRALLRILLSHKTGRQPDPKWAGVESHYAELMRDEQQQQKIWMESMMALKLAKLPEDMAELVMSIFCRIMVNSFRLTLVNDTSVGLCFDPVLALANHSCIPNAFMSVDGRRVSVRALHPIKENEEIRITYIDSVQALISREMDLKRQYLFKCTCPRCQDDLDVFSVFLQSPVLQDNDFTMVGPVEKLISEAKTMQQDAAKSKPTYEEIKTLVFIKSSDNPRQRVSDLRAQRGKIHPSSILFSEIDQELYGNYLQAQMYAPAFFLQVHIAFHHQPFEFPEPWHPVRVATMLVLHRLLKVLVQDREHNMQTMSAVPRSLVQKFRPLPTMVALLLMTLEYIPRSHGSNSGFAKDIRGELDELVKMVEAPGERDGMEMIRHGIVSRRELAQVYFDGLKELGEPDLTRAVIASVDLPDNAKTSDPMDKRQYSWM